MECCILDQGRQSVLKSEGGGADPKIEKSGGMLVEFFKILGHLRHSQVLKAHLVYNSLY